MRMKCGVVVGALLTVGCGPSQRDYAEAQQRAAKLESQVASLTREKDRLATELEEVKFGPEKLLAQVRNASSDQEIVAAATALLSRHPKSAEAEAAAPLLRAAEARIAETQLAQKKAEAARDACVLDGSKLAPYFNGTNISKVVAAFDQSTIKAKDQFETSANYDARVAKEIEAVANPLQCAVIDAGWGTEYDADKQRWNVSIYAHEEFTYSPSRRDSTYRFNYVLESKEESKGTYTGSNAFGVKRDIERKDVFRTGVSFPVQPFKKAMAKLGGKVDALKYIVSVPMSTDLARKVDEQHLKFLVQYQWAPEFVLDKTEHHSPKIDEPYESDTVTRWVQGIPIKILVINHQTGDILAGK